MVQPQHAPSPVTRGPPTTCIRVLILQCFEHREQAVGRKELDGIVRKEQPDPRAVVAQSHTDAIVTTPHSPEIEKAGRCGRGWQRSLQE